MRPDEPGKAGRCTRRRNGEVTPIRASSEPSDQAPSHREGLTRDKPAGRVHPSNPPGRTPIFRPTSGQCGKPGCILRTHRVKPLSPASEPTGQTLSHLRTQAPTPPPDPSPVAPWKMRPPTPSPAAEPPSHLRTQALPHPGPRQEREKRRPHAPLRGPAPTATTVRSGRVRSVPGGSRSEDDPCPGLRYRRTGGACSFFIIPYRCDKVNTLDGRIARFFCHSVIRPLNPLFAGRTLPPTGAAGRGKCGDGNTGPGWVLSYSAAPSDRRGWGQAPPAVWGGAAGAWLMALTKNDAIWARVTGWSGQ